MAKHDYLNHSGECLRLAAQVADAKDKLALIDMARAWLRLAEQAEKNSRTDLVYETPFRRDRA